MICSQCSKTIKPIVAIDIDGTLGDYHSHFLQFMAAYLGSSRTSFRYEGTYAFGEWCADTFDTTKDTYRQVKLAYRQGGMKRSMPLKKGAKELVKVAHGLGCEVWITTTRPYLRHDSIDPDTRFWLDRHGLAYDGLLYDNDKYETLCEQVDKGRVIAVFDDLTEQYDAAMLAFGQSVPFLVTSQFNRGVYRPNSGSLTAARIPLRGRYDHWRKSTNGL